MRCPIGTLAGALVMASYSSSTKLKPSTPAFVARSLLAEELHTEAIRLQGIHDLAQVKQGAAQGTAYRRRSGRLLMPPPPKQEGLTTNRI